MTAQWPVGGTKLWSVGDMVGDDLLNAQLRDPLEILELHTHAGASGEGASALVGVDTLTFDDATAPSAPSSGKTTLHATSSRLGYIPNGGSTSPLSDLDHVSRHEPGGSDPIAASGADGTATLRKLGTASTEAAPGDHGAEH